MPAYVRKQPLIERIKAWFDIYDVLLWLSEEIESHGWEQVEKAYAVPIGIGINLAFLIARANVGRSSKNYDDVFRETSSTGWGAAVVSMFSLSCLLCTNMGSGLVRRPHVDADMCAQHLLHFLQEAPLSALRSTRRCGTADAIGSPSEAQLLACLLISSPIPVEHVGH